MAVIYLMSDTWNDNAIDFNAIRMSVTDTTSGAGSLLFNLLHNASSMFRVSKDGTLNAVRLDATLAVVVQAALFSTDVRGPSNGYIGFTSGFWFNDLDIAFKRVSPGLIELNTGTTASYAHAVLFTLRTVGVTFASLPTAASMGVGARAFITDGVAAVFNTTATNGGANILPVFSDGVQWRYG